MQLYGHNDYKTVCNQLRFSEGVFTQAVAKKLGWKFINANVLVCAAHKLTVLFFNIDIIAENLTY